MGTWLDYLLNYLLFEYTICSEKTNIFIDFKYILLKYILNKL